MKKQPKIIVPKKSIEKMEFKSTPEIKIEVLTQIPLPEGHVRCMVLKEYEGMDDYHEKNDIIDLPERRYKSLSLRGVVQRYEGTGQPNKRR
jgi:hypothetical protein